VVELCLQLWLVKVEGCERNQSVSLSRVIYIKITLYAHASERWLGFIRCSAETIIVHWLLVLFFCSSAQIGKVKSLFLGGPVWVPSGPDLAP